MSTDIYAGIIETVNGRAEIGPIIPFAAWSPTMDAPDADERSQRGEDFKIPNPAYVPNAGMSMSQADALFDALGFDLGDGPIHFPLDEVHRATMRLLNGNVARHATAPTTETGARGATFHHPGCSADALEQRLRRLLAITTEGRKRGATILVAA